MIIRVQVPSLIYCRIAICSLFFFILTTEIKSQNIVPNYSFEDYSSLPNEYGDWWKCDQWDNVNGFVGFLWPYASPDYLHTSGTGGVDLPISTFGTLDPHEGEAIMGFIAFYEYEPDYREYLSAVFTTPMVPGTTYTVSFWISNGETGWYVNGGCENVAIQFSEGPLLQIDHEPIGGTPQVEIPGIFWTDVWELITFTYTADAPYDKLTIGNFNNDASTAYSAFAPYGEPGAYYFIDEITVMPELIITTIIDTTICIGSSYTLPDGTIIEAAGTYNTVLTGAGGADSIIVTNLFVAPVYEILTSAAMCAGGIYILPDGTEAYGAGTYFSYLLTSYGCDSTIITVLSEVPFLTYAIDTTICEGETYFLPDGITTDTAGIYITTLITASGCDSIITTDLSVMSVSIVTINASVCSGSTYTLPDGIEVSLAGIYTNTFISVAGCDSTIITNLITTTDFDIIVEADICEGEEYVLPDGIIVTAAETYNNSFVTAGGCDSSITTNLEVHPIPIVSFELPEFICIESGNLLLVAIPAGGVFSGTGVSGNIFDPVIAGVGGPFEINYLFTDINGCISEFIDSVSVIQNFADAGMDTTINYGETILLNGNAGGDYNWEPSAGLNCSDCSSPTATPVETTNYILTSTDENGCFATDLITVTVIGESGMVIPNAFSPNHDGANDVFHIVENGIVINYFTIYDRWGQMIYSSSSAPITWDGTFKGKDMEVGVYIFKAEYVLGEINKIRSGTITLLR